MAYDFSSPVKASGGSYYPYANPPVFSYAEETTQREEESLLFWFSGTDLFSSDETTPMGSPPMRYASEPTRENSTIDEFDVNFDEWLVPLPDLFEFEGEVGPTVENGVNHGQDPNANNEPDVVSEGPIPQHDLTESEGEVGPNVEDGINHGQDPNAGNELGVVSEEGPIPQHDLTEFEGEVGPNVEDGINHGQDPNAGNELGVDFEEGLILQYVLTESEGEVGPNVEDDIANHDIEVEVNHGQTPEADQALEVAGNEPDVGFEEEPIPQHEPADFENGPNVEDEIANHDAENEIAKRDVENENNHDQVHDGSQTLEGAVNEVEDDGKAGTRVAESNDNDNVEAEEGGTMPGEVNEGGAEERIEQPARTRRSREEAEQDSDRAIHALIGHERPLKDRNRYVCRWSVVFGGSCTMTCSSSQSHDRHVCSHIPDTNGHVFAPFVCELCSAGPEPTKFDRRDPCVRHVNKCHTADEISRIGKENPVTEETRPWCKCRRSLHPTHLLIGKLIGWPSDLFVTAEFNKKQESLDPRPVDETRTWAQFLNETLERYPQARNHPIKRPRDPQRRRIGDTATRRPTKRARLS